MIGTATHRSGRRFTMAVVVLLIVAVGCGGGGITRNVDDPDLLYEEAFTGMTEGSFPSGWTLITMAAATLDGPADWSIRSGRFHQASNVHAPPPPGAIDTTWALNYEGTMVVTGDTSWTNITYRVQLFARDDDAIGVVFRWQDAPTADADGNFYRFLMVRDEASGGPKRRLDKKVDGVWTVLDERTNSNDGYAENKWYLIEIDMVGANITVRVDGNIVFEVSDPEPIPARGLIGLFCYGEEGADFDNIRVYRRGP
ncbi:family 16 glycoside hydrolase [Gemmatimonadota bacterium]